VQVANPKIHPSLAEHPSLEVLPPPPPLRPAGENLSKPARKQASKQAGKQAGKESKARKQAGKEAGLQVGMKREELKIRSPGVT